MADRISIDKQVNESIIPIIDKTKFFNLDISHISRTDLFLFAMSIGISQNKRTPLKALHGFILDSSIVNNADAMSMLHSVLINELRKTNEEEKIGNKDEAYIVAQEYANTGFNIIGDWLSSIKTKNEEAILWELIADLDSKYQVINENNY